MLLTRMKIHISIRINIDKKLEKIIYLGVVQIFSDHSEDSFLEHKTTEPIADELNGKVPLFLVERN